MSIDVVKRYGIVMDGQTDNSDAIAKLAAEINAISKANQPLPRIVFPEGVCSFDHWTNFAVSHLQMVAEGQCILKHTGTGDAVIFDGDVSRPAAGSNHLLIENFIVQPNVGSKDAVVFKGIHRSSIKMMAAGCGNQMPVGGIPNAGFNIQFSVATEFWLKCTIWDFLGAVNSFPGLGNGAGILINDIPIPPGGSTSIGPTTGCNFYNPVCENMYFGIFINRGNSNVFYNGVCETCTIGTHVDHNSGYNKFLCMDLEANSKYDCEAVGGAHSNIWWNNGNTDGWRKNLTGWNNRVDHNVLDGLFGM